MSSVASARPRRVPAADDEPLVAGERHDYADAFEATLDEHDPRTPADLVRTALEESAWPIRQTVWAVHRHVLRFRLGARSGAGQVMGWKVVRSDADVIALEAESPLMRAVLVMRRVDAGRARVSTYLFYRRPAACRAVWAAVGPLHRAIAPYLIQRAVLTPEATAPRFPPAPAARAR